MPQARNTTGSPGLVLDWSVQQELCSVYITFESTIQPAVKDQCSEGSRVHARSQSAQKTSHRVPHHTQIPCQPALRIDPTKRHFITACFDMPQQIVHRARPLRSPACLLSSARTGPSHRHVGTSSEIQLSSAHSSVPSTPVWPRLSAPPPMSSLPSTLDRSAQWTLQHTGLLFHHPNVSSRQAPTSLRRSPQCPDVRSHFSQRAQSDRCSELHPPHTGSCALYTEGRFLQNVNWESIEGRSSPLWRESAGSMGGSTCSGLPRAWGTARPKSL